MTASEEVLPMIKLANVVWQLLYTAGVSRRDFTLGE
jgi:hypothetical protein